MMNYYYHYYIQTNLICLILLYIIFRHSRVKVKTISSSQILLGRLMLSTMLSAASDLAAGLFRGSTVPGAKVILYIVNVCYFLSITECGRIWFEYVVHRTGVKFSTAIQKCFWFPALLMHLLTVTTFFTNFLFSINDENLYVRGTGVLLHWVVCWFYFIFAFCIVVKAIHNEKSKARRNELLPLLRFIIAPVIASVLQMIVYGITTAQVGITISILMICLNLQDNLISKDELTGISNRKHLNNYMETALRGYDSNLIMVIMIDINNFKKINDNYGHLTGDHALIATAQALKRVRDQAGIPLFLCRFGGDEFVLVGVNPGQVDEAQIRQSIKEQVKSISLESNFPFTLEVSVGIASGSCETLSDFEHYLRMADEFMYDDKKQLGTIH